VRRTLASAIVECEIPAAGAPTQPLEKGWHVNTWFRLRDPDYDRRSRCWTSSRAGCGPRGLRYDPAMKSTCCAVRGFPLGILVLAAIAVVLWSTAHRAVAAPAQLAPLALGDVRPRRPMGTIPKSMHEMDDALKALAKPITAETRAAALESLAKFESAVIAAKAETPPSAAKVEETKRAAFVADYRKTLLEALKFACDAETAALDGKYKDADTLIRNKLGGLKSTGHSKFKGEEGGK
jgi:hypothetical protein